MHSAVTSQKAVTKFLYSSLGVCLAYVSVGYYVPFLHNELFHLPYMAVAEISLGRISLPRHVGVNFTIVKSYFQTALLIFVYTLIRKVRLVFCSINLLFLQVTFSV